MDPERILRVLRRTRKNLEEASLLIRLNTVDRNAEFRAERALATRVNVELRFAEDRMAREIARQAEPAVIQPVAPVAPVARAVPKQVQRRVEILGKRSECRRKIATLDRKINEAAAAIDPKATQEENDALFEKVKAMNDEKGNWKHQLAGYERELDQDNVHARQAKAAGIQPPVAPAEPKQVPKRIEILGKRAECRRKIATLDRKIKEAEAAIDPKATQQDRDARVEKIKKMENEKQIVKEQLAGYQRELDEGKAKRRRRLEYEEE